MTQSYFSSAANFSTAKEVLGKERDKEAEEPQISLQLGKQGNKIYYLI